MGGEEMNALIRTLTLALLVLIPSEFVPAQKNEIKIETVTAGQGAVPGQMVYAFVSGVSDREMPPIPINRFAVSVTQDGVAHEAKLPSTAFSLLRHRLPPTLPSLVDNAPSL